MENHISKEIILKWLRAWSLSRGLPSPIPYTSGFKVNVGFENQKVRFVFPNLNEDFFQLAEQIKEPNIFLKFCGSPTEIKYKIPTVWSIEPQGYMMFCFHEMKKKEISLSENYRLSIEVNSGISIIKILTKQNVIAAEGRVVLVEDLAIYDRIITNDNHRRKGLASFLMKELEKIALSKNVCKNFLVATEDGRYLYESLGWELYSLYTSIVIRE